MFLKKPDEDSSKVNKNFLLSESNSERLKSNVLIFNLLPPPLIMFNLMEQAFVEYKNFNYGIWLF
jgi:hypothetical protein